MILMGHSDIGVTLNVYTHLGLIDAKEEMNRIFLYILLCQKYLK
ncbi:hypothetical protein RUMOBE_00712 [Blautia obeum ATCC 29174]|uniref:Tyr recombinase domain-containing protein n=1 Tax=Blautia obeum ATCC 29174 TaxID=411459 RepID=A5ZNZ5_9FIRM|nr:hypothetical protein RUMOBE_00712 [Blautia obeum ATCC 29174]